MRRTRFLIAAAAVILMAGTAAHAYTAPLDATRSPDPISRVLGAPAALEPMGRESLPASSSDVFSGREAPAPAVLHYRDPSTGDEVMLDERGVLKGFVSPRRFERARGPATAKSDAELVVTARACLEASLPGSPTRVAALARRAVHRNADGSADEVVEIEFRDLVGGIPSCNYVALTLVPSTGEVLSLSRDEGPLPVGLRASVPRDDAVRRAASHASMPVRSSERADLVYFRDPYTRSVHLAWHVVLATGAPGQLGAHAERYVDAVTGGMIWGWDD